MNLLTNLQQNEKVDGKCFFPLLKELFVSLPVSLNSLSFRNTAWNIFSSPNDGE